MFPQLCQNWLRECVSSKISVSAKCQQKHLGFFFFRGRPHPFDSVYEFGSRVGVSASSSINGTGHMLRNISDLPAHLSIAPHEFPPKEPSILAGAKESPWPLYQHHSMFSESESHTEVCQWRACQPPVLHPAGQSIMYYFLHHHALYFPIWN